MSDFYVSDTAWRAMAAQHFVRAFSASVEPPLTFENTYFARIDALVASHEVRRGTALDLGCGMGASSFRLASRYPAVRASDLSPRFIATAIDLRAGDWRGVEAEVGPVDPEYPALAASVGSRVEFRVADALVEAEETAPVDSVLALNLICRLPDAHRFLAAMERAVAPGGLLVLASPYTFGEAFSPPERWVRQEPRPLPEAAAGSPALLAPGLSGTAHLAQLLGPKFRLLLARDLTFPFRDAPRRLHLSTSEVTLWRRLPD